jgi:hypothetical protein
MTVMQKEIQANEKVIELIGYHMVNGFLDDSEKYAQAMAVLIVATDNMRKKQEEAFNEMPWLRKQANA